MGSKLSMEEKHTLAADLAVAVYVKNGLHELESLERDFSRIVEMVERLREVAAEIHAKNAPPRRISGL